MALDTKRRLSFGIKTSQAGFSYQDILSIWLEADGIPLFEHAWLWDHMVPLRGDVRGPALEAWTLLSALAAQTKRLRLGVILTSNRLRPPTVLAKMAATTDIISGGRLILGIGAGGFRVVDPAGMELVQREYGGYGIDIVSPADAIGALGEACTIIRRMWTETEPFDYKGRFYLLKGAVCEPKPLQKPGPPILIGAAGEKLGLRVVAEQADVWLLPATTAHEFGRKSQALDDHCRAIGRDPNEIARATQLLVAADGAADARRVILEFTSVGCTQFVLAPRPPYSTPPAAWLAREVIEPVVAETSSQTTS
ncbi:MAG TPA: LLM class flavin-dependent oxidoreductase [Candidatus Dormibacteraeota bacterium]|nr:LLM class flavin-dependent oxidoreductase [Candidatus Dormibacteraeota bacterium]